MQMNNKSLKLVLMFLIGLLSSNAYADVYKCKINGQTIFSDTRCADDADVLVIHKESEEKIAEREQRVAKEKEEKLVVERLLAEEQLQIQQKHNEVMNSPDYQKIKKQLRSAESDALIFKDILERSRPDISPYTNRGPYK
jgi:hypothetical protein